MHSLRHAARTLSVAALALGLAISGVHAQPAPGLDAPDLAHGALLFHGNYCGPGNRGPHAAPVDALDRACMRHDACTPEAPALPSCACNTRLRRDADLIARNPRQPDDLRSLARAVADGATLLPCRPAEASRRGKL